MTEPAWLTDREQRTWRAYLDMQARLTARMNKQLQTDSGLSLPDFDVLVQLTDQEDERARVLELAHALQWEKSRLSHHLARMERRGLVERQECPDDARGAYIALTTEGRQAIEQAAPQHVNAIRDLVFDQLTTDQIDTLYAISDQVITRIKNTR